MRGRIDGGSEFGALLRRYRGLSGLTQEELAERSGLHVQAVSMLERGVRRQPRSTTVEFLAEALKLDARQREAFVAAAVRTPARRASTDAESLPGSMATGALAPRAPLPAGSRVPLPPNPLFVGRGDELLQISAALEGGGSTVALGQVVVSTGLAGIGKTQLAVEFVHRYGRFFAGGVFWLSFASAGEIPLQIAACAGPDAMDLAPGIDGLPLDERVKRVQRAWQSDVPRLLVFDNCEEEGLLAAWRPPSGGCRVLVTSRRSHWAPTLGVTGLPLDLLPRSVSIELLRRYRPDLGPDDPGLDAIAGELGDLPLALHLTGSYLRAYRAEVSLDDYLLELRRAEVVRHASLLGAGLDDSPSPTRHLQGVVQTFALCLGRLDPQREVDRVAIALLARMASLAPGEPVPRDLLAKTLVDTDPRLRMDGLRRLGAVGLVEEGRGWLRLHRLLAHFVRQRGLDPGAQPAAERALIECGDAAESGHLSGPALTAVIPHLLDAAGRVCGDETHAADLCDTAGLAMKNAGDLRAARPWFERSLAIRERTLGPRHQDTATSLHNLAELQWASDELDEAALLYRRALDIRAKVLGPVHPDTAHSLSNLAGVLHTRGELAAALPLYRRALAIRERVLGPDHVDTTNSLNNLAVLLRQSGQLASARGLYERALAIRERVLGPDHPHTANSLNNLAVVLRELGEPAVARPLIERALAIRERALGADHPLTVFSVNSLARILQAQGRLPAARSLLERALATRERVLGPDHRDTAHSLHNLAALLREQGEDAAAGPLLERALAVRERALGPDHIHTATSLHSLAVMRRDRGDLAAARPLFERALTIRERVLGRDHPDTVATGSALAELRGVRPDRSRR